jgi:hypothetical protein
MEEHETRELFSRRGHSRRTSRGTTIERTNEKCGETIKEMGGRRRRHERDKARE